MGLAEGSRGGWQRCRGRWAIGVGETHFRHTLPRFFPRKGETGHSDLRRHPSAAARSPSPTRRPRLPAGSHRSRSPRRRPTRPLHLRSSLAVPTSCQEERSGGAAGGAVNWGSLRRICSAGTGPRSEEEEERPSRGRGRVGWGVLDVPPGGLLNWAWAGGGGALEGALWRLRRPVLGGAPSEGCLKPVGC